MDQLIQIIGSIAILTGFALNQRGVLAATSRTYLLLNLAGSCVLTGEAIQGQQFGFLVLEGVWAVVSAISLATTLCSSRRSPN